MSKYQIYRTDKNGNKIPIHRKTNAEIILDIIEDKAKKVATAAEDYLASDKAKEHAELAGRIAMNVTKVAGNSLIQGTCTAIELTSAVVLTGLGVICKDKDTIIDGGEIAFNVARDKVVRIKNSAKSLAKTGSYYYANWDNLSNSSKKKLIEYGITTVAGVFLTAAMWHEIGLDSSEVQDVSLLTPDIDDISYIHNGVYVGDSCDDLQDLISLGELDNTEHFDNIDRNMAVVNEFLNEHNLERLDGYEVHHIIPLSQGGADTPDNMVLISSDLHHQITAAHNAFYGWHS